MMKKPLVITLGKILASVRAAGFFTHKGGFGRDTRNVKQVSLF